MKERLISGSRGFGPGLSPVLSLDDPGNDIGIEFSILKMAPGEDLRLENEGETAVLLMRGRAEISQVALRERVSRSSLFDGAPSAIHCSAGTEARIRCE